MTLRTIAFWVILVVFVCYSTYGQIRYISLPAGPERDAHLRAYARWSIGFATLLPIVIGEWMWAPVVLLLGIFFTRGALERSTARDIADGGKKAPADAEKP